MGSNDVQQFLGGDVVARCFGGEPGGKFFNGDRHQHGPGSPSALLLAFELSAIRTLVEGTLLPHQARKVAAS